MNIGICDDERGFRSSLRKVVERELQLNGTEYEICEYQSGEELLRALASKALEILFLDIEMAGISGMEAAKKLRETYRDTVIIFVTAYPDFVFQGYEVRALHYILKPYKEEKIKGVLHMALEELHLNEEQYYLVEQKSQTLRLPLKEVQYFQSDRKKVTAVMNGRREEFYVKLIEMESQLPKYFVKSHNRYLVNLNFVSRVENNSCICGEEELPVSRGCKQALTVAFARMMLR